jgi:hypothetical protein
VACYCVVCTLQVRSCECLVASRRSCGCPGLKLGARLRISGCVDCLRRWAGEGIDQGRASVRGVGRRVRRRRARHCHEGRASVMVAGEDVAIVMG